MRNELLQTVVRGEHKKRLADEYKMRRRLRKDQEFIFDTNPDQFNALDDDDKLAGVIELGVLNSKSGQVDTTLDGRSIVIGGREHKLQDGKLRIVDKKTVDDAIIPILQERAYKDAVMSAILSDRSGRIARLILPLDRYNMLKENADLSKIMKNQDVPRDVREADSRPEMFSLYHESSKEFALAVHKLSLIVDRTELAFSEEIQDWLGKYGAVRDVETKM
jgi:hypothetical protein